jgi:hypothetical protein
MLWIDAAGVHSTALAKASSLVYARQTPRRERIELSSSGRHFAVHRLGRLQIYDARGSQIGEVAGSAAGIQHKLLGNEPLVLVPVVIQAGFHDERITGYQIRTPRDTLIAQLSAPEARFTRPSAEHVTIVTRQGIEHYTLGGERRWTLELRVHDLAVAERAERMLVVSEDDPRTLLHLDRGRVQQRASFRSPIWNIAIAADGRRSAVTTQDRLHLFDGGVLVRNISLPLAYAVSLDMEDDGRLLIGGQSADHLGLVFNYDFEGRLLATARLGMDDGAFSPEVRFLDLAGRYLARTRTAAKFGAFGTPALTDEVPR